MWFRLLSWSRNKPISRNCKRIRYAYQIIFFENVFAAMTVFALELHWLGFNWQHSIIEVCGVWWHRIHNHNGANRVSDNNYHDYHNTSTLQAMFFDFWETPSAQDWASGVNERPLRDCDSLLVIRWCICTIEGTWYNIVKGCEYVNTILYSWLLLIYQIYICKRNTNHSGVFPSQGHYTQLRMPPVLEPVGFQECLRDLLLCLGFEFLLCSEFQEKSLCSGWNISLFSVLCLWPNAIQVIPTMTPRVTGAL